MVSAQKDDIDKIRGFGLGADDYITKPFSPSELTARAKAHLSRYERLKGHQTEIQVLAVRGLGLDPETHKVTKNGSSIDLTVKEFEILRMLMKSPDRVFSKEEIFNRIWGEKFGDLSTVTVHVRRLRERIEDRPSEPEYIETVWGVGYRFKT
jgi:DNA-binding response OmpR family regulator